MLALFDRIRADNAAREPAEVEIILLGDLIDRGPDSAGVVRQAMAGCDFATLSVLRGNHEAAMIEGLYGDADMFLMWVTQGGDAALRSWGVPSELIEAGSSRTSSPPPKSRSRPTSAGWLIDCPLTLRRGDYYFAHAGLRPGVDLDLQSSQDTLWIRDAFLNSDRHHGVMVVHGHSISAEVEERHNRHRDRYRRLCERPPDRARDRGR
jgi:serine/threonine protein phosphatase 1